MAIIETACSPPMVDDRASFVTSIARLLKADTGEIMDASRAVVDTALRAEPSESFIHPSERWLIELLSAESRNRLVGAMLDAALSRSDPGKPDFRWIFVPMLPWLTAAQVDRLTDAALRLGDDYDRQEVLVWLLPRIAELHGIEAALRLRESVRRADWGPSSWAALWPWLPDLIRADVLPTLMPTGRDPGERPYEAIALGEIAPWMGEEDLASAAHWVIATYRGGRADLIKPLIAAASRRPQQGGYRVWQAILAAAAQRPRADALDYLAVAIPLAERLLGGARALRDIDQAIRWVTEWWP